MSLICLPWAGAGAAPFRPWGDWLAPDVETWAVRLPGRESRIAEEPVGELAVIVEQLADQLPARGDRPFALFGHCSGGLIALELARELRRRGAPPPTTLFLAAQAPPSSPAAASDRPLELQEILRGLGPAADELLQHEELFELMRPAIEADLRLARGWDAGQAPVAVPISVLAGDADEELDRAALEGWKRYTSSDFTLTVIEGDHFFSGPAWRRLAEAIAGELRWAVSG